VANADTLKAAVASVEQEYIELTAIQPIAYNVVLGEFATAHPLPEKGMTLRI
jgi:hypothetical protein